MRSPSSFDLVVRGRLVLPGRAAAPGALAITDGRIAAVAEPDAALAADDELDAGDALVLPGAVDAHVHTGSAPEEGIERCTRAAAAGGVTTVVDMPYDAHGMVADPDAFAAKAAAVSREAHVDVALWATLPPQGPLDAVEPLLDAGAVGFKLSTFDTHPVRFPRVPDDQLAAAFARIGAAGGLAALHSENDELVRARIAALREAGRADPAAHAESRPPAAETAAIAACLELAHGTGVRLHLCHVTIDRGVELAVRARADGVDVSAETCIHYLLLDERELDRRGGEAKINPPLRPRAEVEALWRRLAAGDLTLVSSDHVGWPAERKRGADIFALSSGAPGVELILPLLFSALAEHGLPAASSLAWLLGEAPARRLGLWPHKGSLLPGADADLVVLEPGDWVVDPGRLVTPAGWSPYAGRAVHGRVRRVLARGTTVFADGAVVSAPGRGELAVPVTRREAVRA